MKLSKILVVMLAGALVVPACTKKEDGGAATPPPASGSAKAPAPAPTPTPVPAEGSAAPAAGAALTDADLKGMMNTLLTMLTDLGKAATGAADCPAAAAGMTKVLDGNQAFFDKMAPYANDKVLEERAEKLMQDGTEDKLRDAMKALDPTMEKCEEDAAMKPVIERLEKVLQ